MYGRRNPDFWPYCDNNNEQLAVAQESGPGSLVGEDLVAAVGQADDSALVSNDINQLQFLLNLAINYCDEYQVELAAGKTKLLLFNGKDSDYTTYYKLVFPIHIGPTDSLLALLSMLV